MHTNQHQGRPAHARLAGAALLALLGTACSGLGAGGGPTVASARLVEQIDRVSVETERSEETVDDALERLQPIIVRRPRDGAAAARAELGVAFEACQVQARRLEGELPALEHEGRSYFGARRDRVAAIEDPVLRVAAAAELERDLERFLEYQASASAALVTYDELNDELDSILQVLAGEPCVDALTEAALDLRNQAWSLRMVLEDCERAAVAFESR